MCLCQHQDHVPRKNFKSRKEQTAQEPNNFKRSVKKEDINNDDDMQIYFKKLQLTGNQSEISHNK